MTRRAVVHIAAGLLLGVSFGGCLIDGTLEPNGGGTVVVKVHLMSVDQYVDAKKQAQSPEVTLTSSNLDDQRWATFNMKFADVTKLSTTELFRHATFTLSDGEGGTRILTVKYVNPSPQPLTKEMADYFGNMSITMHLPGEVVKSDATKTDGKTATWEYTPNAFGTKSEVVMSATFKRPAG